MKVLLIFLLGFTLVAVFIGNAVIGLIPWHLFDFLAGGLSVGLGVYFKFKKKVHFLPYTMGFGIAIIIGMIVLILQT